MMTPEERQAARDAINQTWPKAIFLQHALDHIDELEREIIALRQRIEDLENTAWEKSE